MLRANCVDIKTLIMFMIM